MGKLGKKVVLVGHCGPDSSYLRMAVSAAGPDVSVTAADDEQSLQRVLAAGVDLVLLNRILDYGFDEDEGVPLIARLKGTHPNLKTMLVSNYADAQAAAVAAGALPGFGKREIGTPKVKQLLQRALVDEPAVQPKQAV
jgi:two-component system chemotaxis response regulator CheY